MKDLDHLTYFFDLKVFSNSNGYYLSQAKYTSNLLSRASLTDNKTTYTIFQPNAKLIPLDATQLSNTTLYRQLVGNLVYLTVTRPDISHVIHLVSQYMAAPQSTHYAVVLHILRYVKGTLFHGLYFVAHSSSELRAYSDTD